MTQPCPLCVPWQMHSNLLEKISAYNMSQFSQLVSAVMVKSWPVRSGQCEGDFDKILHHLLTWPDVKHIFSFNGRSVLGFWEALRSFSLPHCCHCVEQQRNCPALVLVLEVFSLGLEREGQGRGSHCSSCADPLQLPQDLWTITSFSEKFSQVIGTQKCQGVGQVNTFKWLLFAPQGLGLGSACKVSKLLS